MIYECNMLCVGCSYFNIKQQKCSTAHEYKYIDVIVKMDIKSHLRDLKWLN